MLEAESVFSTQDAGQQRSFPCSLSRFAGVSEAGACRRNPEPAEGSCSCLLEFFENLHQTQIVSSLVLLASTPCRLVLEQGLSPPKGLKTSAFESHPMQTWEYPFTAF